MIGRLHVIWMWDDLSDIFLGQGASCPKRAVVLAVAKRMWANSRMFASKRSFLQSCVGEPHPKSISVCVCLLWISFFSRLTCRPRLCLYVDTCTCAFSVLLSIASYSSTVPNIRNKILKSTKKNVLTNGTCTYLHLTLTHSLSLSLCLCVSVTRSVLTSCYQEIQSNHIQSPMQKKAKDQLGEWHLKQSTLEVFNHLTALNSSFQLSIAITASHQLLGPWWHPKMTRDTTEKYHVLPFWRYYCYTESMYKYTVYPNLWLVSIQISMCLISQQIQPLSRPPSVPPREPFATARWCARQAEAWEGQGTGTRSRPRTWSKAMFFGRISHRKRVEKNHQIWKELVFWGVIRILISPKFGAAGALNHSALQDRLNTSR